MESCYEFSIALKCLYFKHLSSSQSLKNSSLSVGGVFLFGLQTLARQVRGPAALWGSLGEWQEGRDRRWQAWGSVS